MVCRLVGSMFTLDDSSEAEEAFAWQLDAVRRHLQSLPGDSPELAHLFGIAQEVADSPNARSGLRLSLTAYAYYLEHEGRLAEALQVLGIATRTYGDAVPPSDFAASSLFAARLNRLLARWPEATNCYQAAEEAANAAGDRTLELRGRLGRAAVLRGMGNLPQARAIGEEVAVTASKEALPEMEALAYTNLGAVYSVEGKTVEFVQANYKAFVLTEDPLQRMWILGDIGTGLVKLGAFDSARVAFEIVLASDASFQVQNNARLELMEVESSVGNRMSFERRRAEAEEVSDRMPPSMVADFHFKAATGLVRFGQMSRGRALLEAGMAHSESHKLNAWYFRFEQKLAELAAGQPREPEPATYSEAGYPALDEVAVGLREYAAAIG